MSPTHTNPTYNRMQDEENARAPYNFIPLPGVVLPSDPPIPMDRYAVLTGWIECNFETKSPVYVRGMLTEKQYREQGQKNPDELTPAEKEERSLFFQVDGAPVIPGSSLRGLIRSIVEIASFSRMRWVGKEPVFTYRAVASQGSDPLKKPYQAAIGTASKNVRAGYLHKDGDEWYIQPAMLPKSIGFSTLDDPFVKVDDEDVNSTLLPGFLHFNDMGYKPQFLSVSFQWGPDKPKRKKPGEMRHSIHVEPASANLSFSGMLVCSGNMLETASATKAGKPKLKSPREKHVIIMDEDPDPAKRLTISDQVIKDYRNSLTPYERENLGCWAGGDWGCLAENAPVFYIANGHRVVFLGHCPNFRIPAILADEHRAATPADFLPKVHQNDTCTDLADILFGWTPESDGQRTDSRAGQVFVGDARLLEGQDPITVWYKDQQPITPPVLGSPKATTFQHYLTQDKDYKHNPNERVNLAHYGSPKQSTQIRGHKMYWHKGRKPAIELEETLPEGKNPPKESQLTRISPVNPGTHFRFKVWFENLRDWELGALMWALQPLGQGEKMYCHKLGMGKPLGMGAIYIDSAVLHLTDRKSKGGRYGSLFQLDDKKLTWKTGEEPVQQEQDFRLIFEKSVSDRISAGKLPLQQLDRIQELLAMMEWRGDQPKEDWLEWTRYMEIEHGSNGVNEYKNRPVLPTPRRVAAWSQGQYADDLETPGPPVLGEERYAEVYDVDKSQVWLQLLNMPEEDERCGLLIINPKNATSYPEGKKIRVRLTAFFGQDFLCIELS